jgi:hypothetical protein
VCWSGTLRPNREPAAPIFGDVQVIESAVGGPPLTQRRIQIGRNLFSLERRFFGVVQVLRPQFVAVPMSFSIARRRGSLS